VINEYIIYHGMPKVSRRKRSTRSTRKSQNSKTSKVSKATKKYVRRVMPKTETKQVWAHHNEVQLSTLAQGYQSLAVCQLSQGVNSNQRVGNVANFSAVHLRGVLNNNSTSESYVRMIVIGYPSTNGDPTLNLFRSLPTGTTTGVSSVNGLDAIYYPLNKVELKVYTDKVYRLAGSATGNSGSNTRFFSQFIKFGGKKVEFKASTTGTGNQSWMYSIIWIASDANDDTSTGTAVELSCLERLYFRDA